MKKYFPLTMFLFMAVFFSGCQGFISPKKNFSSIKIVLPGKNNSSRGAETVKTEGSEVTQNNLELNFIFTVSDKDGEKVSLEGKSGETLVAEVEPGIYSVSLKGYLLDDVEFTQPICEASQDKVEVIAGEVTKVVLELKLIEIEDPEPESTGIKLLYELPSGVTDTELLYTVEITQEGKSIYASKEPEDIKDFYVDLDAGIYSVSLKGYETGETKYPLVSGDVEVEIVKREIKEINVLLSINEMPSTGIAFNYVLPEGVDETELIVCAKIEKSEGKIVKEITGIVKDKSYEFQPGVYTVSLYAYKSSDDEKKILYESGSVEMSVNKYRTSSVNGLTLLSLGTDVGGVEVIVPEITLPGTLGISVIVDGEILTSPYLINKGSEVKASFFLPETVTIADIKWTLGDYPFEDDFEVGNSISFDSSLYGELGLQNFTVTVIDQNGKEYFKSIDLIFTGDDN